MIVNVQENTVIDKKITTFTNTSQLSYLREDEYGVVDIAEDVDPIKTRKIRKDKMNWQFTFYARLDSSKACSDDDDVDYEEDCYSGLLGTFAISYDVIMKKKLIETFTTQESVAVFISPNPNCNSDIRQDVVVVMDTSGSMREENKLRYSVDVVAEKVLGRVGEGDRITLIAFSTEVNFLGTFTGQDGSIRAARDKLTGLAGAGFTNINDALLTALDYANGRVENEGSTAVPLIMIYTDGEPQGRDHHVTDREAIINNVRKRNRHGFPIFRWGILDMF